MSAPVDSPVMTEPAATPAGPRPPDPGALRRRITCALLYFASRHIPIPFVDDFLRAQVTKYLIRRTVAAAGLEIDPARLAPLAAPDEHWAMGCLFAILRIPLKILLLPIRTLANIVFAVRHVSRDFTEIFLLGEIIERGIAADLIHGRDSGDAPQALRSRQMRQAFDRALKDTDASLLWGIVGVAVGPLRSILPAARNALRVFWNGGDGVIESEGGAMRERVSAVEKVLLQPEVKKFLAEFNTRYEEALGEAQRTLR